MSAVIENRNSNFGLARWTSLFGGGISLLCALHCAIVPLLFLITPTFKLALYSVRDPNHKLAMLLLLSLRYEKWLVWGGLLVAALVLFTVTKPKPKIIKLFLLGAALSLIGVYSYGSAQVLHSILMVAGGFTLFYAALLNSRNCRTSS